jgi:outer membrane receptor protein involved in Fe transport
MAVGAAGAAAAASVGYVPLVLAADATGPNAAPETSLEEVVVTGSRIRRVDAETANAVFVVDQTTIQDSGIQTVGDLLQRIPSVSGKGTTPNVNNGGGFGSSSIELRGLDARRTLVLVDGRRQGIVGDPSVSATDVNQIPLNLIDHIEVLKEGAGAIYGSDAVGGVVNFITRKDVNGVELGGSYGRTGHSDGEQDGFNLIFGKQTDDFHFVAGGDYHKQKAVFAGARDYSKYALYLYGGTSGVLHSGSSRSPTGRISLPKALSTADGYGGCGSVTRIGPSNGQGGAAGSSLADYRCFTGPDHFNYQPFNLLTTPIERTQAFTKLSEDINEYVTAYGNFTFNHTHSSNEEAPLPFDSPVDDVVISKNSIYNPFGINFGGLGSGNPAALWRLTGLSDRRFVVDTNTGVMNLGVKGKLGLGDWDYDANVGYSRLDYTQTQNGYYLKSKFQNAVGPSFIDPATGAPTCGTLAQPIGNCTPLDIFNIFAPGQQTILNSTAVSVVNQDVYVYKGVNLDFNGTIIPLPAGDLKAAVGVSYSGLSGDYTASPLGISSPPLYLQCQVSNEACTGNSNGHYNSKEEYLEFFAPLLKDLPGVHSLNIDGGVRHSNYSLFGSTTKSEFKIEYRPIKDVLVRGTWAQVFRVPTINDLYAAPVNTSVTFNDPCTGLTSAALAATPNLALACKGVVPNSGFKEPNGQITGLNLGNPGLKPESGTVKTVGLVYDPSWLSGFSIDIDYWEYHLNNLITQLDSNYSIGQCIATGSPTFCNLVTRLTTGQPGQVLVFNNPTFNLGSLKTDGVDLGIKYAIHNTPAGNFQFSADITDTMSYLNVPAPGAAPQQIVGTYSKQFGNYARFRGLATVGWAGWGAEGLLTARYIHHVQVNNPSVKGLEADLTTPFPPLQIGSVIYWDLSAGYNFVTKTKVMVTVQNIADKQPPIFYQNNVTNANTDVYTYDTIGRRWLVSFLQKF